MIVRLTLVAVISGVAVAGFACQIQQPENAESGPAVVSATVGGANEPTEGRREVRSSARVGPDDIHERSGAQEPAKGEQPKKVKKDQPPFDTNAFPPTLSDTSWHSDAWEKNDCLRCHETGVAEAPQVKHTKMPEILLTAMCRTCHVFIAGSKPRERPDVTTGEFDANAFPPMIPASTSHPNAWNEDNCLLCHETGLRDAPKVRHENMPSVLLRSKCRTCHVQVRSVNPVPLDSRSLELWGSKRGAGQ